MCCWHLFLPQPCGWHPAAALQQHVQGMEGRCPCAVSGHSPLLVCSHAGMSLPEKHIGESWGSAEFYTNKLLMQYRGIDERHVAWVKALKVWLWAVWGHPRHGCSGDRASNGALRRPGAQCSTSSQHVV